MHLFIKFKKKKNVDKWVYIQDCEPQTRGLSIYT